MPRENRYQARIIRRLKKDFPGCVVIKNPSDYLQGIPDLLILFGDRWAMLEVKKSEDAPCRPNQPFYVRLFNKMSYASFVYPENEERVFHDLALALKHQGSPRVP